MGGLKPRYAREPQSGFIDVLRSRRAWPAADGGAPGSYSTGRRRLPLPDGPVSIESVNLAAGGSGDVILPGDEFVHVLNGSVRFRQSDRELSLAAGEAGVLLREKPLAWTVDEPTEVIVMRCVAGGGAGSDTPLAIDTAATLAPSNPPLAELLVGPSPSCRNHTDYRSTSGEFVCGTWDSTPYHRRLMMFRHFELMRLLEGEVTFVDQEGRTGTFGSGDVVLLVQGGGASWNSGSHVKKTIPPIDRPSNWADAAEPLNGPGRAGGDLARARSAIVDSIAITRTGSSRVVPLGSTTIPSSEIFQPGDVPAALLQPRIPCRRNVKRHDEGDIPGQHPSIVADAEILALRGPQIAKAV